MEFFLIDSYEVAVLMGYSSVRQLFLWVKPPAQERPATRIILLNFRVNDPPRPNLAKGSDPMQILLPLGDFDDIYHILQTESPAYIQLEGVRAGVGLRIGNFKEPLGEGFTDKAD